MNEELRNLLICMGVGAVIGAVYGVTICIVRPDWARRWADSIRNHQRKLFAFGALFFGFGALFTWHQDRIYIAMASLALFILEIVALSFYGFKSLSMETKQRIDET